MSFNQKIGSLVYQISGDVKELQTALARSEQLIRDSVQRNGNAVKKQTSFFGQIGSKLSAIFNPATLAITGATAAIVAMGAGLAFSLKKAAEFEQLRISFNTFLGSAERGAAVLRDLEQFSIVSPFTLDQVTKAGKVLLGYGLQASELMGTMRMLGDVSAGTGKDLTELSVIFGQISAAGRLQGQDLLQLVTAGFNPLQIMSQKTGKSMLELRKEMEAGLISFDMVSDAFKTATGEGGLFFNLMDKQSQSLNGLLSTLSDNLVFYARNIGEKFLPVAKELTQFAIDWLSGQNDVAIASRDFVKTTKESAEAVLELTTANEKLQIEMDKIKGTFKSLSGDELSEAQIKWRSLDDQIKLNTKIIDNWATQSTRSISEFKSGISSLIKAQEIGSGISGIFDIENVKTDSEKYFKLLNELKIKRQNANIGAIDTTASTASRAASEISVGNLTEQIQTLEELKKVFESVGSAVGKDKDKFINFFTSINNETTEQLKEQLKARLETEAFAAKIKKETEENQKKDAALSVLYTKQLIILGATQEGLNRSGIKGTEKLKAELDRVLETRNKIVEAEIEGTEYADAFTRRRIQEEISGLEKLKKFYEGISKDEKDDNALMAKATQFTIDKLQQKIKLLGSEEDKQAAINELVSKYGKKEQDLNDKTIKQILEMLAKEELIAKYAKNYSLGLREQTQLRTKSYDKLVDYEDELIAQQAERLEKTRIINKLNIEDLLNQGKLIELQGKSLDSLSGQEALFDINEETYRELISYQLNYNDLLGKSKEELDELLEINRERTKNEQFLTKLGFQKLYLERQTAEEISKLADDRAKKQELLNKLIDAGVPEEELRKYRDINTTFDNLLDKTNDLIKDKDELVQKTGKITLLEKTGFFTAKALSKLKEEDLQTLDEMLADLGEQTNKAKLLNELKDKYKFKTKEITELVGEELEVIQEVVDGEKEKLENKSELIKKIREESGTKYKAGELEAKSLSELKQLYGDLLDIKKEEEKLIERIQSKSINKFAFEFKNAEKAYQADKALLEGKRDLYKEGTEEYEHYQNLINQLQQQYQNNQITSAVEYGNEWLKTMTHYANLVVDVFAAVAEAMNAFSEAEIERIQGESDKTLKILDDKYAHEKELLENGGKTKQQALEDELAAAKAGGNQAKIDEAQNNLDLYNLEKEYNKNVKAEKAKTDKEIAKLEYEAAMRSYEISLARAIINLPVAVSEAFLSGVRSGIAAPGNFILGGALGTAAGIVQGAQIAGVVAGMPKKPEFAVGAGYIPQDTEAIVHKGEMIIPENFSDSIRKGKLSLSGGEGGTKVVLQIMNPLTDEIMSERIYEGTKNGIIKIHERALVGG